MNLRHRLISIKDKDENTIKLAVKEYFSFEILTSDEIPQIKAGNLKAVVNKRIGIGWSSNNHTAGDVGLYVYAPAGIERLTGLVDNTEIPKYLEKVTGLNVSQTTDKLFKNAKTELEKQGATISIDATDVDNPVVNISKGGVQNEIPKKSNFCNYNSSYIYILWYCTINF